MSPDPAFLPGLVLVALGGAAGAVVRHLVDQAVSRHTPGDYPWGILFVNLVGSFTLGVLLPLASPPVLLALGVGFCGALTTYSTVAAQTWGFVEQGRRGRAVLVVVATVTGSLAAAWAGLATSSALL